MKNELSKYEKMALEQIWAWKDPSRSWFDQTMKIVSWPVGKASDVLMGTPGIGYAIEKSFEGGLAIINDISHWSVRPSSILQEYSKYKGLELDNLNDIYTLDLEDIDRVIGFLDTKYEGLTFTHGAAAGATSMATPAVALIAIPADVLALLTLNLRAVGEYASYCGFDVRLQEERLFALNVLAVASSPTDNAKQMALSQLIRVAQDVALKRSWKDLEQHLFVQAVQQISKVLSIRLTKAKLAQVLPIAGVLIGGGFNAYYTNKVCNAAFYLYRERFLAEKYGVDIIETTVEPAKTLELDYEDEFD